MNTKDLIKVWREYYGLNQGDFADKIKVSISTISLWERGLRKNIQPRTAQDICNRLKITYQNFMAGPPIQEVVSPKIPEIEQALEDKIQRVSERLGVSPIEIRKAALLVFLHCDLPVQRSFMSRYHEICWKQLKALQESDPEQSISEDVDAFQLEPEDEHQKKP